MSAFPLEVPWREHSPAQSVVIGPGFTKRDRARARAKARTLLCATLGKARMADYLRDGYLEVTSTQVPGLTYQIRPYLRLKVLQVTPRLGWPPWYLCTQPAYPVPAEDMVAQLYLVLRDEEAWLLRVAHFIREDGPMGNVF